MSITPRAERVVVERVVTRNRAAAQARQGFAVPGARVALPPAPVPPPQAGNTSRLCPSCRCAGTGPIGAVPPARHHASAGCFATMRQVLDYAHRLDDHHYLLQIALNAYTAQHAGPPTKATRAWLSLVGLHLGIHHGWDGHRVQRTQQRLIELNPKVPRLTVAFFRWRHHAASVMRAPEGNARDAALVDWAAEVWKSWAPVHARVLAQCPACHADNVDAARRRRRR